MNTISEYINVIETIFTEYLPVDEEGNSEPSLVNGAFYRKNNMFLNFDVPDTYHLTGQIFISVCESESKTWEEIHSDCIHHSILFSFNEASLLKVFIESIVIMD